MSSNLVSASLSDEDRQAVMDAIQTIRDSLPFLIDLTSDERRSLPKMGDKSRAFVDKAGEIANQNPDILPRSFDLDEFIRDITLYRSLFGIHVTFSQLGELLVSVLFPHIADPGGFCDTSGELWAQSFFDLIQPCGVSSSILEKG